MSNTIVLGYRCSTDVVDLALATGHRALTTILQGRREGMVEGHRRGKRPPKRKYVRRKWDGWKEATLGQFEALLGSESWKTMHNAENNISLAGVVAAATQTRARGHGATPFDDCINTLQQERHTARDPVERKLPTRCVFPARGFRKHEHRRAGLVLTGTSTTVHREKDFEKHWTSIMIGLQDTPAELLHRYNFDTAEVLPAEAVAGDFEAFLGSVAKQKEGRARREDGAVADFIKRLPAGAKPSLYFHLVGTGGEGGAQEQPSHCSRATVSLIPTLLQAALPSDFRPITVLSVYVKLAAKFWLAVATPYLILRRQSSHGSRPEVQAAEVHRLMRDLVAKHQELGANLAIIKLDIAKSLRHDPVDRSGVCAARNALPAHVCVLEVTLRGKAIFPYRSRLRCLYTSAQPGDPTQ